MTEFLTSLGTLTLGGAAAILLFVLIGRLSRSRYGARWRCWAWVLLGLRLAIPVSFLSPGGETQSPAPIQIPMPSDTVIYQQPAVTPPAQEIISQTPATTPPAVGTPAVSAPVQTTPAPTPSAAPAPQQNDPITISLSQVLLILWLAGVAVMLLRAALSHARFLRYLRRWSSKVSDPEAIRLYNALGDRLELSRRPALRLCAGLKAPMLAGLIHPVLLLPEQPPEGPALHYALLHELTHYKRRDIWLKTLALWVNAIHWFNPFMWYMNRLVERDTELACDEAALRRLPAEEHSAYGRTILNAVKQLKGEP